MCVYIYICVCTYIYVCVCMRVWEGGIFICLCSGRLIYFDINCLYIGSIYTDIWICSHTDKGIIELFAPALKTYYTNYLLPLNKLM